MSPSAIARYIKIYGDEAVSDIPPASVTASRRRRHVLTPARLHLDGRVLDLSDLNQRRDIESHHAKLLAEHGLAHHMHKITTSRRRLTRTIAADAFERLEVAAIRFSSRLDGCLLRPL